MPHPRPAIVALLAALALPAAAAPAPAQPPASRAAQTPAAKAPPPAAPALEAAGPRPIPVLHGSAGTGVCDAPSSDAAHVDNPCWLQIGLSPAVRFGALELGLVYEGRDILKFVTFLWLRPPAVTLVGATAGLVHEPSERWRLTAAGEAGWRRYMDFAGSGIHDREGAIDLVFVGLTGRAALGLRPQSGRTDRLEVSVSVRTDLDTGQETVDGTTWTAGGWSFTMGLGLVTEW